MASYYDYKELRERQQLKMLHNPILMPLVNGLLLMVLIVGMVSIMMQMMGSDCSRFLKKSTMMNLNRSGLSSDDRRRNMTLQDLLNQVAVQGSVVVKRFSDDGETENIILETADFEVDKRKLSEDDLNSEIKYLYPTIIDFAYTVIEVE